MLSYIFIYFFVLSYVLICPAHCEDDSATSSSSVLSTGKETTSLKRSMTTPSKSSITTMKTSASSAKDKTADFGINSGTTTFTSSTTITTTATPTLSTTGSLPTGTSRYGDLKIIAEYASSTPSGSATVEDIASWYFVDLTDGNKMDKCSSVSLAFWTASYDRSKNDVGYPKGDYPVTVSTAQEQCVYRNDGTNPGRLFCPSGEFSCTTNPADAGTMDNTWPCASRTRRFVFHCSYQGLGSPHSSSSTQPGTSTTTTSSSTSYLPYPHSTPTPSRAVRIYMNYRNSSIPVKDPKLVGKVDVHWLDVPNTSEVAECGTSYRVLDIDDTWDGKNPYKLAGTYLIHVDGVGCDYKNIGNTTGKVFCPQREIACKDADPNVDGKTDWLCTGSPNSYRRVLYTCLY